MELDVKTTIAMFFILLVWSLWFVPSLANTEDVQLVFLIFTVVYVYASMWFLGFAPHETRAGLKLFLGWFLIFFIFDIIALPFILNRDMFIEPIGSTRLASDYLIYSMLPDWLPHIAKYIITYAVVPTFLFIIAYLILGKRKFETAVRENV